MLNIIETEPAGLFFNYENPQPEQVELSDIARSLSQTVRFRGLTKRFYSVAEHAVYVCRSLRLDGFATAICFAGLHHDDHEAYLGDVPTPLKRELGQKWKSLEHRVDAVISTKLGIDPALFHCDPVAAADRDALLREASQLKGSEGIGKQWNNNSVVHEARYLLGWLPGLAEREYLGEHARCLRELGRDDAEIEALIQASYGVEGHFDWNT